MNESFLSPYNHKETESAIQELWDTAAYANPDVMIADGLVSPKAPTFSIVLPPPNVTGTLHTGHAFMLAIEDTMVRYQRMLGKRTLWIPGTDHAAIATQSKVEKILAKDKINKHDLGRDAFLDKVKEFAQESQDTILSQVRRMGASVDWTRLAYTLDDDRHYAVYTAFKHMYDDGLIYRDYRIVNWDPKGQTVISDDEVIHMERDAIMYTFKYSLDFPIAIATTRPETKVGDTAVAVHPSDSRYQSYIGKTYNLNFCGAELSITIVADEHVDPSFGTGALGVTPAHSQADWEIAQRNQLPHVQVINEYAKMTNCGEILDGMKVEQARESVVAWLKENGLLDNQESIKQNVATAERTGGIIEPLPKLQWWIDTEKSFAFHTDKINGISKGDLVTLKQVMLHVVDNKQITILPERFERVYANWIENLRPWNISRQIWFGHRVPVWYRGDEVYVDVVAPEGDGWIQDDDTLDTWFSSGLWTFSTLGWPHQTEDLQNYHPTQVLETAYDIIFFWVARMILMSLYHLGDIPFETAYFHGLVRDAQGRKMSKSLGNIVDPIDIINVHGTDALRMGMIVSNGPGNDSNLDENKIRAYGKFANKLWNMARYVVGETQDHDPFATYTIDDEKIMSGHEQLFQELQTEMNEYKLYLVSEKLYHYAWHRFADEIIESSKIILTSKDHLAVHSRKRLLMQLYKDILRGLHPFMPFVTEAIWQNISKEDGERKLLMTELWPGTRHIQDSQ